MKKKIHVFEIATAYLVRLRVEPKKITEAAWRTESVEYVMTNGSSVERADGGKLGDADFLDALPKKYVRVKRELNKAKLKADGLDAAALAKLGLVRVATMSMKLKAKSHGDE